MWLCNQKGKPNIVCFLEEGWIIIHPDFTRILTHRLVGDGSERIERVSHSASSTSLHINKGQIYILTRGNTCGNKACAIRTDWPFFLTTVSWLLFERWGASQVEIWLRRGAVKESIKRKKDHLLTWLPKIFYMARTTSYFKHKLTQNAFVGTREAPRVRSNWLCEVWQIYFGCGSCSVYYISRSHYWFGKERGFPVMCS